VNTPYFKYDISLNNYTTIVHLTGLYLRDNLELLKSGYHEVSPTSNLDYEIIMSNPPVNGTNGGQAGLKIQTYSLSDSNNYRLDKISSSGQFILRNSFDYLSSISTVHSNIAVCAKLFGEMVKKRRVRDDLSKNHISVQCIPRSQLFEMSGQLLHSGFGELDYFAYHPTSEHVAFHSKRPITSRLLFRLTNNLWVPFKGKQEDFPFLKNATDGVTEKLMLKICSEEEETRKNSSADTADI
jgi:hypothetical protein